AGSQDPEHTGTKTLRESWLHSYAETSEILFKWRGRIVDAEVVGRYEERLILPRLALPKFRQNLFRNRFQRIKNSRAGSRHGFDHGFAFALQLGSEIFHGNDVV